jgi:hypothetical protein
MHGANHTGGEGSALRSKNPFAAVIAVVEAHGHASLPITNSFWMFSGYRDTVSFN